MPTGAYVFVLFFWMLVIITKNEEGDESGIKEPLITRIGDNTENLKRTAGFPPIQVKETEV